MMLGDIFTYSDGSTYDSSTNTLTDASGAVVNYTGQIAADANQVAQAQSAAAAGNWSWLSDFAKSVPAILPALNAYQISQINIERAKNGQPLINAQALSPQVNVGLSPQVSQMLMYGAIGVAVLFLLAKKRG